MKKPLFFLLFLLVNLAWSQEFVLTGKVIDSTGAGIEFVNVTAKELGQVEIISGASTGQDGQFELPVVGGAYSIEFSMVGFRDRKMEVEAASDMNLGQLQLVAERQALDETVISVRTPVVRREIGKLTFDVENSTLSSGNTMNLLKKTPGVLVVQDNISIRNTPTEIYINNRRVYLSSSEIVTLLTSLDASVIQSIEVITNPSSSFDAEGGAVLNILTSKAISVGYKGNVGATYEQAVFAKYNLNTAHFYKNNWIDFYGSYSYSPRKEFKSQDDHINYFEPDGSLNSLWESDLERTTRSYAHQANLIADFQLNEKNTLNLTSNLVFGPDERYQNGIRTDIFAPSRQLDSLFTTASRLENDRTNLSFQLEHQVDLGQGNTQLRTGVNYIFFEQFQDQDIQTSYFLPDGDFIRNNTFSTSAFQETNIWTASMDLDYQIGRFSASSGVKYSDISTDSGLDFLNRNTMPPALDPDLSDRFLYDESIYAAYTELERQWESWGLQAGLRVEHTDVEGDSRALGLVNTQNYFEWFPRVVLSHNLNEKNTLGLSYARRIDRPRYQSLNPFKYFINETNFNSGNPSLRPETNNKIALSYNYNNVLTVEAYYEHSNNSLSTLVFQDNETRVIRTVDANLIEDFQYSLDVIYTNSIRPWWYSFIYSSFYYLENEFLAEESIQQTYSNSTPGFYAQWYNSFTLSKDQSLTSDLTAVYMSNYIYGSYSYKNQFSLSLSIRKSLWNDQASITLGVDDIFNTNNIRVSSQYYNQDNSYFAMPESRMFRASFLYNFGNWNLSDNQRQIDSKEKGRLDR
ncbi:outer membrane beta-barrel family protein [Aureitalea marina]|uniref:Outer membrane protein beta-barrel domain-containing protein n=1 Tax=Aureitalea marina TaxID=930804 RepID=A0A2S7KS50_9FLAO|nr:outer membrane beta-barrel family protein [Aureitalea marina]PQB05440.1 hypothetical protein BST85_11470 [Aureitalea marina]